MQTGHGVKLWNPADRSGVAIRAVFEVVRCGYLQSAVLRLALPSAQSHGVSCCSPGEGGSTGGGQEIQCLTRTLKSFENLVIKKDKG